MPSPGQATSSELLRTCGLDSLCYQHRQEVPVKGTRDVPAASCITSDCNGGVLENDSRYEYMHNVPDKQLTVIYKRRATTAIRDKNAAWMMKTMPSRVPKVKSGFDDELTVGESSLDTSLRMPGIVESLDGGDGGCVANESR